MTFRESFGMGESVGQAGVQAYDSARSYRERLDERDIAAENLAAKTEEGQYQYDRTQAEHERHDKAVEAEWGPPGSRGSRGGAGMTADMRQAIIDKGTLSALIAKEDKIGLEPAERDQMTQLFQKLGKVSGQAPYVPPAAPPAEKGGWDFSGAMKSAKDFFSSPDVPPPLTTPDGWKPRRAQLANGNVVTETAPGVWPK